VIGLFVFLGIVLALGAGLVLTSGQWMKETYPYVMVFKGDVSGLIPGAPVQYQGVTVGTVESIQLVVDQEKDEAYVPVIVHFDPAKITYIGSAPPRKEIQREVEEGLRAELQSQSLVTGMKKIMLVNRPDSPAVLQNPGMDLPEIPTVPNLGQALAQELAGMPFRDIVQNTHAILGNLEDMSRNIVEADTTTTTRETLEALRDLSLSLEKELPRLLGGLDSNSKAFLELQTSLNETLTELRTTLDRNSAERVQFRTTMSTLSEAAAQARLLFDYLERHPESILTGKPQP
jgi:paraquat-inducible protein B